MIYNSNARCKICFEFYDVNDDEQYLLHVWCHWTWPDYVKARKRGEIVGGHDAIDCPCPRCRERRRRMHLPKGPPVQMDLLS